MSSPSYATASYDQPSPAPANYIGYWVGISLLTVAYILALLIWPPYFNELKTLPKAATSVLFFGRFHPIAVHLPIGVIILSLILELGCLRASIEAKWRDMALFSGFITAGSSVVAVMFGIFLAREGGYKGGAYILHQALGIGMTFGVIIAVFLRLIAMQTGVRSFLDASRFFMFASFGVMSLGAHFGGNMVHGSNYLVEYAPPAIAKPMTGMEKWMMSFFQKKEKAPEASTEPAAVASTSSTTPAPAPKTTEPAPTPGPAATPPTPPPAGDPATAAVTPTATGGEKLVFQDVILPILEAKCNKCHNEAKSKGDLRMDTYEQLMKGGQDDQVKSVVATKPDDSLVLQRIKLPDSEDEHMPPDGKEQLTKEETGLLRWWIESGASNTLKVGEAHVPPELQPAIDSVPRS